MVETATGIRVGMDVYSRDGEKIGCVSVMWPHMPVSKDGTPPEPWEPARRPARTGFFQIDRGGILGLAATHWFVPMSAVASVDDTRGVTLDCTADECTERYTERPWFEGIIAG